jgi:hypothetical protein
MKLTYTADPEDAIGQNVGKRDARPISYAIEERKTSKAVDGLIGIP